MITVDKGFMTRARIMERVGQLAIAFETTLSKNKVVKWNDDVKFKFKNVLAASNGVLLIEYMTGVTIPEDKVYIINQDYGTFIKYSTGESLISLNYDNNLSEEETIEMINNSINKLRNIGLN